jgi:hypothetical protein
MAHSKEGMGAGQQTKVTMVRPMEQKLTGRLERFLSNFTFQNNRPHWGTFNPEKQIWTIFWSDLWLSNTFTCSLMGY